MPPTLGPCPFTEADIPNATCLSAVKTTQQEAKQEGIESGSKEDGRTPSDVKLGEVTGAVGMLLVETGLRDSEGKPLKSIPSKGTGVIIRWPLSDGTHYEVIFTAGHNSVQLCEFSDTLVPIRSGKFFKALDGTDGYSVRLELIGTPIYHEKYTPKDMTAGFDIAVIDFDKTNYKDRDIVVECPVVDVMRLEKSDFRVIGYPGEKWGFMFEMTGPMEEMVQKRERGVILKYKIDTTGGQSGSPVFAIKDGKPCLVGIHNGQLSPHPFNYATGISESLINWLDKAVHRLALQANPSAGLVDRNVFRPVTHGARHKERPRSAYASSLCLATPLSPSRNPSKRAGVVEPLFPSSDVNEDTAGAPSGLDEVTELKKQLTLERRTKDHAINKLTEIMTQNNSLESATLERPVKVWTRPSSASGRKVFIILGKMKPKFGLGKNKFGVAVYEIKSPMELKHRSTKRSSEALPDFWTFSGNTYTDSALYSVHSCLIEATPNGVRMREPLKSTAWDGPGLCTLDDRIYIVGGTRLGGDTTSFESMSLSDCSGWHHEAAQLPHEMERTACAVVDSKVYVAGGQCDDKPINCVYSWSKGALSWTPRASMNNARFDHALVACGGHLYAIGGWSGGDNNRLLTSVERYEPHEDGWLPVADMPRRNADLCVAVYDNVILVLDGGECGDGNMDVDYFDTVKNVWSKINIAVDKSFKRIVAVAITDDVEK